jgi:hypothetical protein
MRCVILRDERWFLACEEPSGLVWTPNPADAFQFPSPQIAGAWIRSLGDTPNEDAQTRPVQKTAFSWSVVMMNRPVRVEIYPWGVTQPWLSNYGSWFGGHYKRLTRCLDHQEEMKKVISEAKNRLREPLVVEMFVQSDVMPALFIGGISDTGYVPSARIIEWVQDAASKTDPRFENRSLIHVGTVAAAKHPDTSPERLQELAMIYPEEVVANPVMNLLSLSEPAQWRRIQERVEALRSWRKVWNPAAGLLRQVGSTVVGGDP